MEREEKDGSGDEGEATLEAEKKEFFGLKLRPGISVGKKGVPNYHCTTPVPTWKLSCKGSAQDNHYAIKTLPYTLPSTVSARKLGAELWEEIQLVPLTKMRKGGVKLRQLREKSLELPTHLADPSNSSPEQPESASSLRRHVAASLMKHHQSIERNSHALQPVSPASYSSSMEVATYIPPITPTSSLDIRGRHGGSSVNLKTSTELLKVLNRIWSLEEQHTSNISLIKALKIELNHARARTKELLQEKQADRQEIDDLMKQVAEENLVRKSKEQDRIKAAVQSVKDELEDERKLRKRSESLHRKLARELSEVKYAFAKALKELERERKARILLEDLCDEFAKGIGEYEQEVRTLNHKSEKDHICRDDHDRLILHISEAWLDERMQMKLAEARSNLTEKDTVVEKLSSEIETFLQAKRSGSSNSKNSDISHPKDPTKDSSLRRQSLESVHLNDAVSAPRDARNEEESPRSDSHCIELSKNVDEKESEGCPKVTGEEKVEVHLEETKKSYPKKKKLGSRERIKGRTPSDLQVQFEEQMGFSMPSNGKKTQPLDREEQEEVGEANKIEMSISQKSKNCENTEEGTHERKVKRGGTHGSKSNNMTDKLIRSQSILSDAEKFFPEKDYKEDSRSHSAWRRHASPVQQWMSKFTSPDTEISESSSKWPRGLKESTLKAKLLEARLEGQHSRVKASKGTS
ncbi:hypothetical protein BVC80_8943g27 [Macleaya cordata]|uniref:Uncharacterized protein n=1 Tax=Macleaya cordata TaxID=56857 RepID=A0A200Q3Q5_MACCD|nr:hypothetical protein BVC80_8943g27 [Macleaya cordata]